MEFQDFVFLWPGTTSRDIDLMVGPIEAGEIFDFIRPEWTLADLVVIAGCFPSKSQAKKNGWDRPIPSGFFDVRVGKKKTRITSFIPLAQQKRATDF